ncbi:rhodanese-like domain-containing protein [Undibacterium cyanobacteriorum]|uniref:Rhodanese-like domain-containing protein n=1 Tax=Undibacterium cyanobacteriorum TaxID=3073561 RepID=A0ABY9RQ27_9BURK|nr:rhodanese-like domain-containing protein [Undibacterium sp. 20NA77.5]WMW82091.1 rhodanese-like domain-containing protein [Undibacterium sp. 20NA77.5]
MMMSAHDLVVRARDSVTEFDVGDAPRVLQAADVIIDVREADEYQSGHLPRAINIPRGVLEFKLSSADTLSSRDLQIVLYCKSSGRATLAAQSLQQMGYRNVHSLAGGFDAYCAAGMPVIKPIEPAFD